MPRPIPENEPSIKRCRELGTERRERILADLADYFTGDRIEGHEVRHFLTIAWAMGYAKYVKTAWVDAAATKAGRVMAKECMVALAVAALQEALKPDA
jgi:hypothetical protein